MERSAYGVARADTERGELVLRRRGDEAIELRVNGVFVMDTVETSSERDLATASLAAVRDPRWVLVAGLGLGFTARAVLDDPRVEHVDVAELEPALVDWLARELVPGGVALLADPRVRVTVGDVAGTVAGAPASAYDVILLDVDNGPDFLVHEQNAALYRAPFLARCRDALTPTGVLVVWSMSRSSALLDALRASFGRAWTRGCPVRLGGRDKRYWLHLASAALEGGITPSGAPSNVDP